MSACPACHQSVNARHPYRNGGRVCRRRSWKGESTPPSRRDLSFTDDFAALVTNHRSPFSVSSAPPCHILLDGGAEGSWQGDSPPKAALSAVNPLARELPRTGQGNRGEEKKRKKERENLLKASADCAELPARFAREKLALQSHALHGGARAPSCLIEKVRVPTPKTCSFRTFSSNTPPPE